MRKGLEAPGLRLQILLALGGVMLVAYVPLFFAIAQVTRGTALAYRDDAARNIARAIAARVGEANENETDSVANTLVGDGGAYAIRVFADDGSITARSGDLDERSHVRPPPRPYVASSTRVSTPVGRVVDVVAPRADGAVLVRVLAEDDQKRTAKLVRGIALYMFVFALGLLVFAYIALTRAIVRPIEQLARATDRIAGGARELVLPSSGAREIAELGASVREMTSRLLEDERALRAKVEELMTTTKRLGETREQLAGSERMASIGKLAAGVAHEIGNPIAAIMGMHDLIDDRETSAELRDDFLRRMRKETERIHVVVRDLLDFARPEEEPSSSSPSRGPVAEVVDDVFQLVRHQRDIKEISLRAEVGSELVVALSPQRLTQVLLNLVLNAGAALDGKAGSIVIRGRAIAESRIRIEVEDDGPGVPRELAARVFDPFFTTKDVGAGTGLGLAVCRGIVEGANGTISVDPTFESGARFVIELPRA